MLTETILLQALVNELKEMNRLKQFELEKLYGEWCSGDDGMKVWVPDSDIKGDNEK
jgi:hypothetical protein